MLRELSEELYDDPGIGAVVHIDGRAAHPSLQVVHRQRDVLGVALINITRESIETTHSEDFSVDKEIVLSFNLVRILFTRF